MAQSSFQPIVLVHGGAGDIPDSRVPAKLDGVRRAARRGYQVLQERGCVLDSIVAAVELMEDEPAFNAGKGSVLTLNGEIEMEALISEGKDLKSGAVTLVKNIAHPIALARQVMEETPHAFLGGAAVNEFAARMGVPKVTDDYLMTPAAKAALDDFKRAKSAPTKMEIGEAGVGTVGCVAIDTTGHMASATSTGGITGKYNGRIGDTPLLGCGGYADDERGTVSTTGHGETIMRYNLAQRILCDIATGKSAQEATKDQCESMTKRLNNTAGAITISHKGEVGIYFTSKRMAWAYQLGDEIHYGIESGQHLVDKPDVNSKATIASLEAPVPLAEQMRPSCFEEYIGQSHVLGHTTILRNLLDRNEIPSMILWGPPGCGKTSLAHIISKECRSKSKQQFRFVKLSATMAGVNDVKEAVKLAKNELTSFKRRTILFMDEIHRFNKLQQDIFLPHVESGCIILIGATTENPSFSLNSALLSRCRVFVLQKLATEDIISILTSAAQKLNLDVVSEGKEYSNSQLSIDQESLEWLAGMCDGDARIALNSFHMALKTYSQSTKPVRIKLGDIQEGIKRSHLLYDRKGEEHYNIISALHKSIRASDENAALYWLARMLEGGEDPIYIARRLVVCASEDIGMKDPHALTMAMSAVQACQLIGMPECGLFLAHISTYLARAPKSREVYDALNAAKQCVRDHKGALPSVPLHLRNAPTKLMKQLGYGAGYNMQDKGSSNLTYMPEGMEDIKFF